MSKPNAPAVKTAAAHSRRSGLGTWFDHHLYSLIASLGRMLRKPWSTALTIGVMALALALSLGLWSALSNVERFAGDVQEARQISVFLKPGINEADAGKLADTLRGRADVAAVESRSPEQGLAELRAVAGLGETIAALDANPLPHLFLVTPASDEVALAAALGALPETDMVQHDAAWRDRLDGWLRFGGRLAWVLAAMLGLGALLVVGNTVRLDIQQRTSEIGILQLLGATDGFIRRPFLYLGLGYGLVAGALALALLTGADAALRPPLASLALSYGSDFALRGFSAPEAAAVLTGAGLLGWLGAWLVTGHYLRQTRPTGT